MTEKQYAPTKTEKKMTQKVETPKEVKAPVKSEEKKTETKKETKKPEVKKIKKDFAIVDVKSAPISTKYAISICKFIKWKTIADARRDLEEVLKFKKAVPMKGEYAHKKNVGRHASGSGKYPKRATEYFIMLLKSLAGNTIANGMDEPIISEAIANQAPRPFGRFGRVQRKRTHIFIKATEKSKLKKEKKK